MKALRIGTRGSPLALWQARAVAALLEARGRPSEICVIKTAGDRLQDAPLSEAGGKGLFVKEIEDALLARRRSTSPSTARRTCRWRCPTGSASRRCCRARIRATRWCCRRGRRGARRRRPAIGTGSVRRSAQLRARLSRRALPPHSRQRRHAAAETGCRRVRRARAGGRGPEAARPRGSDLGRDSPTRNASRRPARASSRSRRALDDAERRRRAAGDQ